MQEQYVAAGAGLGQMNKPTRESAAVEVMRFADQLSNRAQDLAKRVEEKLGPIAMEDTPKNIGNECKEARIYPLLFSEFRNKLLAIESAFNSIDSTISRTEL